MGSPLHLVTRFLGSLRPGPPKSADDTWARSQLLPAEIELWEQMWNPDRRHAAGVARRVQQALGAEATRPVLAAALLHDVGKVDSGLHTYGRSIATVCAVVVRRDPDTLRAWSRSRGFTRNVGLYLRHAELGGDRLQLAGSDPLTVAWAREHHQPEDRWTIPHDVGEALRTADDD